MWFKTHSLTPCSFIFFFLARIIFVPVSFWALCRTLGRSVPVVAQFVLALKLPKTRNKPPTKTRAKNICTLSLEFQTRRRKFPRHRFTSTYLFSYSRCSVDVHAQTQFFFPILLASFFFKFLTRALVSPDYTSPPVVIILACF